MPKIDWLQYTVKEYYSEEHKALCIQSAYNTLPKFFQDDIISYCCSTTPDIKVDVHPGINMYTRSFCFKNGIRVCYAPIKEDMGYNVIISGDVLSSVSYSDDDLSVWFNTYSDIIKLTRIDIAWDSDVDFSYFANKFDSGEFVTRLRDFRKTVNQHNRGTLYFGRRDGNLMVRVYDKRLEQIDTFKGTQKQKKVFSDSLPSVWTRFEMQFRHSHANQAFIYYLTGVIGNVAKGHFRFVKTVDNLSNVSRDAIIDDVYKDLINSDGVIVLSNSKPKDFNMQYFITNVMSQVKAVIDYDPYIYAEAFEQAVVSKTTLDKLRYDELKLVRDLKRIRESESSFERGVI